MAGIGWDGMSLQRGHGRLQTWSSRTRRRHPWPARNRRRWSRRPAARRATVRYSRRDAAAVLGDARPELPEHPDDQPISWPCTASVWVRASIDLSLVMAAGGLGASRNAMRAFTPSRRRMAPAA